LKAGEALDARVHLKDGRYKTLHVVVAAPRPRGVLIAKNVQLAPGTGTPIELTDADELPLDATLTFSIRTLSPQTIARDQQVEIATADGANSLLMSVGNGRLTLESRNVAVARLQPADTACQLGGTDLYLVDSIANNRKFTQAVHVAEGFPGNTLQVPNPSDGKLYIRLRDNPSVVNAVTFAVPAPPAAPATVSPAPGGPAPVVSTPNSSPAPASGPAAAAAPASSAPSSAATQAAGAPALH
jgi:hypothetical protein